jgi:hypothetical protein
MKKRFKRRTYDLPDFRDTKRGAAWLAEMIQVSEELDAGKKAKMETVIDRMQAPLLAREREPGEEG